MKRRKRINREIREKTRKRKKAGEEAPHKPQMKRRGVWG